MDAEKLAKMQQSVRTGGKGTMRRKKKVVHKSGGGDDKKLAASLKRLQVNLCEWLHQHVLVLCAYAVCWL